MRVFVGKEFGHLISLMMVNSWFRLVRIKVCLFGIPRSQLLGRNLLAMLIRYTVPRSVKMINLLPRLVKEHSY